MAKKLRTEVAPNARDTAFCSKEDDGRYCCWMPDYIVHYEDGWDYLEARGKTKQHALYNLKLKLLKIDKEHGQ